MQIVEAPPGQPPGEQDRPARVIEGRANRIGAILDRLAATDTRVFFVILAAAALIAAARICAPFEVGKDQGLQIEAAHRLAEGQGLTITHTNLNPADISESPTPMYLTWWPPALSLVVAGFLITGMPLVVALKIIYSIATMAGWLGWAIIASRLLSGPVRLKGRAYQVHLIIAALLPVFYTPIWDGTDIFLWAGVPFVLLLCFGEGREYRYVIAAGLLLGFLYAMRYASLFAFVAAVLILLQVSLPNIKAFLKKAAVLALSSLALILPTVLYVKLFSLHGSFMPAYAQLSETVPEVVSTSGGLLHLIDTSAEALVFTSTMILANPLPARVVYYAIDSKALTYALGFICLLVIIAVPLILIKRRRSENGKPQEDISLSVALLPLSLTAFFIVIAFGLGWSPLGIERYYEPVIFCLVLVFYELAASKTAGRFIRIASASVIALFILYTCAYIPARAFSKEKRRDSVRQVLGYTPAKSAGGPSTSYPIGYPDFVIYSRKENSRQQLRRLSEENPEAVFYVLENYQYYVYDEFRDGGPKPGKNFRFFPGAGFWEEAYTSKSIRVFWILDDKSASMDSSKLAFIPDSNLKPVFSDPFEKTRIFVSDFPAGYRFGSGQAKAVNGLTR